MTRIHGELYEKSLNDLDNNDGVVSHLGSDMLECEIRWALASGGNGYPVELSKILKADAVKMLHSICQK